VQSADIIMINQLLALYGHIVDAAQWDRFDELFLPDAELDYTQAGADAVYRGIPAIQDFFRSVNHPSAHHCVNIYVAERDGIVRVTSKFFAPYTRESHAPKRWKGGDYLDVVEDTPYGWRFRSRVCIARWQLTTVAGPEDMNRRTW
jgi:3-phenylpropionate/cinnamic acid dioxygenase small subunit